MLPRLAKSQSGSAMVILTLVGGVAAILLVQMLSFSVVSRKQALILKVQVRFDALLDSMIDYTTYAIRNRWCLSPTWSNDPVSCDLSNPRNVELLLLGKQSIRSIRDYAELNGLLKPDLDLVNSISANVQVSSMASTHPLFIVLQSLTTKLEPDDRLEFRIRRLDGPNHPTRGNEVMLEIEATIRMNTPIFDNLTALTARSRLIAAPRELGTFSLIVPRDLRLDQSGVSAPGDFSIPPGTGGRGVIFKSPVFINRDLHLPNTGTTSATSFLARAVLGDGRIVQNSAPYEPSSAGGIGAQKYNELSSIYGLLRGLEIDGQPDRGLYPLAGLAPSTLTTSALMEACKTINQIEYNLELTRESDLLIKPLSTWPATTAVFEIGMSGGNRFWEQRFRASYVDHPTQANKNLTGTNAPRGSPSAVLQVEATVVFAVGAPTPVVRKFNLSRDITVRNRLSNRNGLPTDLVLDVRPVPTALGTGETNRLQFSIAVEGDRPVSTMQVRIIGFDVGTFGGRDRRYASDGTSLPVVHDPQYSRIAEFSFSGVGTSLNLVTPLTRQLGTTGYFKTDPATALSPTGLSPDHIYAPLNLEHEDFRLRCQQETPRARTGSPFSALDWTSDNIFVDSTRQSWNFTNVLNPQTTNYPAPAATYQVLNSSTFHVHSIAGRCTIPSAVDFVAGFLNCDRLVIEARGTPLTIVGTVIASQSDIAPSAVQQGITFMSIYDPDAVYLLRARGLLVNFDNSNCSLTPTIPIWQTELSAIDQFNQFQCNVPVLRTKADPFMWTTVTPECGVVAGSGSVSCLRKPRRFLTRELWRSRQKEWAP